MKLDKIKNFFAGTRSRALTTGVACFALVSAADYILKNEISLEVFYFIPIFILTWQLGRNWGFAATAAGIVVWLTDERVFAADLAQNYQIVVWNAVVRLAFFSTVVILMDEMKKLVSRERAVSKLKSDMIHTVSHEFNNALTGLSTGLYLLKEGDKDSDEAIRSQLYTSMHGSQQKLALYVKNILNEARMEGGRFKIEKRPVALRDLAQGCVDSITELLKQKNIKFSMQMPEKPLLVSADSEALALVVSNLLGNAVKYTPAGGEITVRIEPAGARMHNALFSVEDSGIGISLADLKRIADGFYRTAEAKAESEGFGLGLKIANELLTLHGSHLEISSEKGRGSRFYFELPVLSAKEAVKAEAQTVHKA